MNLRQKVKQAKRELAIVEEKYRGSSTWDIVQRFQAKSRLQKIIDYKKKPNRFFHWNEEHEIDWGKLTYISLHADSEELSKISSANGKPLSEEQVETFLDDCRMKIYQVGTRVKGRIPSDEKYTSYVFFVSNDRTRRKRLHMHKLCHQYYGDDMLHPYRN